jgi:glycine oxidase
VKQERSVAVAGGGIIGISIAWRLAQRGCRVTVFEKNTIGGEASWAGAGMLAPGGEIEDESELSALVIESRRLYSSFVRELEDASGLAIDYQECGALSLAYSVSEWDALQARAARQEKIGITSKPVTPEHVAAFWPRINMEGLAGALFYAGDGIVNPRDVTLSLAAACRKLDVSIHQNRAVHRVSPSGNVVEVETADSVERYDAVVIAAGAWSSSIAVNDLPALPSAEPVKGHLVGYQQPAQTCGTIIRHGSVYLLQRVNGLLIAGASTERVGFDRQIQAEQTAALSKHAARILPHLQETTPTEAWIGFRPASDALHIGPWHSSRLYLAYGHYRNGIVLAPLTADRLATMIAETFE